MCLIVKEGCKIEIAKEDITTYKHVRDFKEYWRGLFYPTQIFLFNQVQQAKRIIGLLNVINVDHLELNNDGHDYNTISNGFHSYLNRKYSDSKEFICIIPKESEYCLGKYGEIVSNKIIVFRTEYDYFKYRGWTKVSSN